MSLFCAFNHKTSLVASNGILTLYDGEEGQVHRLLLPDDAIIAVTHLTEGVAHVLTHRGVYDLRENATGTLTLTFVGNP